MSTINIKRAIDNIRVNTTAYTPVVELIVNAIQAIDETKRQDGKVLVRVLRSSQDELYSSIPDVEGFTIEDNGVGFTDEHLQSFDTLYTDRRIVEGGKGFGRFTCLKYFDDVSFKSIYRDREILKSRHFSMGRERDIIVKLGNSHIDAAKAVDTGTIVTLKNAIWNGSVPLFAKGLDVIARGIVERILPYFIRERYSCPTIVLSEIDGSDSITLNDFVSNAPQASIHKIHSDNSVFTLHDIKGKDEKFTVMLFRFYSPRGNRSKVSLVAHKREVSDPMLHHFIPEFSDDFYDDRNRNYIIRAYVFSDYLDKNVSLERGSFYFGKESDLIYGISQDDISSCAANVARDAIGEEINLRQNKKRNIVQSYVDQEAPWYKRTLSSTDLTGLPYNPKKRRNRRVSAKRKNIARPRNQERRSEYSFQIKLQKY